MTICEVKTFDINCDTCSLSIQVKTASERNVEVPKGWVTLTYETEGGGHYGLPHHYHKKHVCFACIRKGKDSEPEGCFHFLRKEH